MKKYFKRLKLSQYLLMCQIITTSITLVLKIIKSPIVDYIGLSWNILNGIAVLIAFMYENAQNVKYYEITGQFIFNKLGGNFSEFMDFLMSDEYKKTPFEEQRIFQSKLIDISKNDTYDTRRKISRALPYLYNIDKKMTVNIIKVLRDDIYKETTDIRRRTLEAILTIIQKGETIREKKRRAKRFESFVKYYQYDDSYTIVACIEDLFYLYENVAKTDKDKKAIYNRFELLKKNVNKAQCSQIGKIEEDFLGQMDEVWKVLKALIDIKNVTNENYKQSKDYIDSVLQSNAKYSKLTVVKNLFYTCQNYPKCLNDKKCSVNSTVYMLNKIHDFLTHALNSDIYLAMPTVRYFDCVCNNLGQSGAKDTARKIIREYFSSDNMLINQTAFDKFAKLISADKDFSKEAIGDLLVSMNENIIKEAELIKTKIDNLDSTKKQFYTITSGRLKFKLANNDTYKLTTFREEDAELKDIDEMIHNHYERLKFIGKIKSLKEENCL